MKALFQKLKFAQARFENWFNNRFGWFFTNGNKDKSYSDSGNPL